MFFWIAGRSLPEMTTLPVKLMTSPSTAMVSAARSEASSLTLKIVASAGSAQSVDARTTLASKLTACRFIACLQSSYWYATGNREPVACFSTFFSPRLSSPTR